MSSLKWFLCGFVLKVLDIITTLYLVLMRGSSAESNPIVSDMMSTYGTVPGLLLNGAIVILLLYVLSKYERKKLLIVSALLMFLVVVTNLTTIFMAG